ncbi:DUF6505 family protein [Oceanicella actignis]|uniref:DUF6505 family protein n=1 Tax=Oceanicella actignis TaxID=1189325 RepID=UPI0011E80B4C|nr:DUF6505 family protein [Oceanicella actignis]TYO90477.1 hypothetical protein LY05_00606 [Oceanicella actignis]
MSADPTLKLARTLRLDDSDALVFERPAEPFEWAISGAFEFSNWTEADLAGKRRQAFANGWLGLESFGRATLVAVTAISPAEYDALIERLSAHFVERYGAPDLEAARGPAREELEHMRAMCEDQPDNAILTVSRELVPAGVKESFRVIPPREAGLESFAVHGG